MTPHPVRGVITLALDVGDEAACTRAALAAHRPGVGRITVHPTPAAGHPEDLALDVLAALGKPYAAPSPWTRKPDLLWAAAAAWIHTLPVWHLIILRAHLLTAPNWHHLLELHHRTGVHLTIVCHRTPPRVLTDLLHATDHRTTTGLPPHIPPDPFPRPPVPPIPHPTTLARLAFPVLGRLAFPVLGRLAFPVLARLAFPVLGRLAWSHALPPSCACTPRHRPRPLPADLLLDQAVERIHRLAHPQHAAALAVALATGTPTTTSPPPPPPTTTPTTPPSPSTTHPAASPTVCRPGPCPCWTAPRAT
ncbi:hypothetical protein GCM10009665_45140 [Kitasatospora nipponensis]|uniref:Uncharacterized protein n=1 Tax=Kitasatospora nipponensis TaxID=258049 RepID=A0ABN1WG97_9ACTN